MLFYILRPPVTTDKTSHRSGVDYHTFDPRYSKLASWNDLHLLVPPIGDGVITEAEAVAQVRELYPDAVGMPFPLTIGSGQTVLLGFVVDMQVQINPDAAIPFVLFVQAVSENDFDRKLLKKGESPFDRKLWRLPPVCPKFGQTHAVEIRMSEWDVPTFGKAKVGYDHKGRLTMFAEVGGTTLSVSFENGMLQIVEKTAKVSTPPCRARGCLAPLNSAGTCTIHFNETLLAHTNG